MSVRGEWLARTTHDLGEDDAGIPPRAHQRRARHLLDQRETFVRLGLVELLDDRAGREGHVRPRVAVRDRIDVEVVDPLPAALERGERCVRELPREREVAHALERRTSRMRTSTLTTRRPVRRSTSYWTRLRSVDAPSPRLGPYPPPTFTRSFSRAPPFP